MQRRLPARTPSRGFDVRGFVTHELRERGRGVGFEVETIDGRRETLAHVFRRPFTDALKRRSDVGRIRLRRDTRNELPEQLAQRLSGAP
jgi:hypothetical protein